MENVRYEEYTHFNEDLPFYFQPRLIRTKEICSTSPNWHDNIELQLCTNGEGEVWLDGEKYVFQKGDVVIVNSSIIHYTRTDTELEYSCLIIDMSFFEKMGFDTQRIFTPYVSNALCLQNLFNELETNYRQEDVLRRPLLNLTLLKILIEINRNYAANLISEKKTSKHFSEIKKSLIFLRNNYTQKITLDEIAQNVLIDKFTLSKDFKKLTGQTIITYLNGYRCQKAAQLISNGYPVSNAALQCGFDNISYFIKTFKNVFGKLPSSFKKT